MFWARNILVAFLQRDFLIALLGLAIGSFGLVYFFRQVSLASKSSAVAEFGLKPGKTNMCLVTPDGNVGAVELNLEENSTGLVFRSQGSIKLKFQEKLYYPSFTMDSEFSVLGQLVTLLLRVKVENDETMLGLVGINPMMVTLIVNRAGASQRHDISIPGPFELREYRKGMYRLFYTPFQIGGSNALISNFVQSARQKLPLSLVLSKECEGKPALDVTPIAEYVHATVSSLYRWLPARSYQR